MKQTIFSYIKCRISELKCLWCFTISHILFSSQVSATFAASLVTSPAIGAYLSAWYGDNLVVLVATLIALADICFILLAVPESLPDKMRLNTWGAPISWEQADPFAVSYQSFIIHYLIGWLNNKHTAGWLVLVCSCMKSFLDSLWFACSM